MLAITKTLHNLFRHLSRAACIQYNVSMGVDKVVAGLAPKKRSCYEAVAIRERMSAIKLFSEWGLTPTALEPFVEVVEMPSLCIEDAIVTLYCFLTKQRVHLFEYAHIEGVA